LIIQSTHTFPLLHTGINVPEGFNLISETGKICQTFKKERKQVSKVKESIENFTVKFNVSEESTV
jgi:hypothetical protein